MKTLEKLEDICEPHGVEFDAYKDEWGNWNITFMLTSDVLGSSTATVSCYHGGR